MTHINRKLALACVLIVVLLIIGMVFYPEDEDGGSSIVTVEIRFGEHGDRYRGNVTTWEDGELIDSTPTNDSTTIFIFRSMEGENQTVFSALQVSAEWGNFSVEHRDFQTPKGVFVESIGGVENGPHNWQYYLNDEYAVRGSDAVTLKDGDLVIWSYE